MALVGPLYTEYRIVLPYVSVDQVKIGVLYTVCIASLAETGGGEGVEFIINPYEMHRGKYEDYQRMLYLSSKVPGWIRVLAPGGSMEIVSKTWDDYPKIHTEYSNPEYMKDNFYIIMDTLFVDNDNGNLENVFGLDEEILRKRDVIDIDIVNDPISPEDYKEDTDPSKVRLEKINRGPLTADWKETETNFMTVYMFVKIEFKWWGLQNKAQKKIKEANTRIYRNFYRTLICKLDEWYGMTMDDMKAFEAKTNLELQEAIKTGEPIGINYD